MLNKLRELASRADRLPDASRLKIWFEIFISILTAPTTFIAGVAAAGLGFFQWYLPYRQAEDIKRELMKSPVLVNVEVKAELVKDAAFSMGNTNYIPVAITAEVKNNTQREFRLMDSRWMLNGVALTMLHAERLDPRERQADNNNSINSANYSFYKEKHNTVASGSVFGADNVIRPSETLRRTFLAYIPAKAYAYIRISLAVPVFALSVADFTKDKHHYNPRLVYLSDKELGLFEWRLCPENEKSVIEEGVNANDDIKHKCKLTLKSAKIPNSNQKNPIIDINTREYIVSIVTADLPLPKAMKK